MKRLVIFDLDGTLAVSKSAIDAEMGSLLDALLDVVAVSVISGGAWPQFEKQVLPALCADARQERLWLLPTCGTKMYRYSGSWNLAYAENMTPDETHRIANALATALRVSDVGTGAQIWGPQIEDRGTQVTLSALGQQAPIEAKVAWDPDGSKRRRIRSLLTTLLPDYSVRVGGTTSIDVTRPGIDKAYGIGKLQEASGIAVADMVFVGDSLFAGGNDHPAIEAGVCSIAVTDPSQTKIVIRTLVACLDTSPVVVPGGGCERPGPHGGHGGGSPGIQSLLIV